MNSIISIIMMVALFLGNITVMPASSGQIRSGELKFKAETKLNKPLDKKLIEEMDGVSLDNLSAEFNIKYKISEDLKKLEMQCDMLLSNGIDKPMQISFWSNLDYSDKNIPKTLFIFKQKSDDKYQVVNVKTPVINRGITVMVMLDQFFNTDMISSVNKNISDILNKENFNITDKNGALSAVMDESTLKMILKQIVLGVSEYIAPYFAMSMMTYNGTTATRSTAVIEGSDDPMPVNVLRKTDEKTEKYRKRIINELEKIDGVANMNCDIYISENGSYQADINIEVSDDDSNKINRELERIVSETDASIQLARITYSSPTIAHNIKVTTQEEIKSQYEAIINEFFAKLENVKIFKKDALVSNMVLDDKKLPKTVSYDINVDTNLEELVKALGGQWNDDISRKLSNLDMTVTCNYAYSKVNEEITIDYPKLTDENSVDMMNGNSLPDIDINAVSIVVNDKLTQLNNKPLIIGGVVYLPLREMLNLKGIADEYILWDDGIIQINSPDLSATLKIDSDEMTKDNQKFNTGAKILLKGDTTYIPVVIFRELGIGGLTNTFLDENNNIIGCVISVYKYTPRKTQNIPFLISDGEPMWEKYLYEAGDMAGVNVVLFATSVDNYIEQTNIIIAAGEPTVMIGKYSDEFINKMMKMDAIYPAMKVNDEYSVIIPKVFKNTDSVLKVVKNFTGLLNQK